MATILEKPYIPVGSKQAAAGARGDGDRREEREARQEHRETESSQENMDGILQAVAEAISEAEREGADATEDPQAGIYGAQDATTAEAMHETREANARRLANNFLQSMEGANRNQPEGIAGEGVTRRRGK